MRERGQVEILTGAYYDPLLPAIPERDRRGQIDKLSEYLEKRFRARPRGAWVAERVWEPHVAATLVEATVTLGLGGFNGFDHDEVKDPCGWVVECLKKQGLIPDGGD